MFCVTVGLYILFVIFRPKLQHSWYKRILVAGILAVGVTLMHFVALLGTHYWAIQGEDLRTGSDHGTKVVISACSPALSVLGPTLALILARSLRSRDHLRRRPDLLHPPSRLCLPRPAACLAPEGVPPPDHALDRHL